MNREQLTALWIAIGLIALIGLFPPWIETFRADDLDADRPLGHRFLLSPPEPEGSRFVYSIRVDVGRLAIMWFVIAAVGGGAVAGLRGRGASPSFPPSHHDAPAASPTLQREASSPPQTTTSPERHTVTSPITPWRRAARWAFAWNQVLLLLLFLGGLWLLIDLDQWRRASEAGADVDPWTGINLFVRAASLLVLWYARTETTHNPHFAGRLLVGYFTIMAGLGIVGMFIAAGMENTAEQTIFAGSLTQFLIAALAGILAAPLTTERGQALNRLHTPPRRRAPMCPKSTWHRVRLWSHPGPCPKCGTTMKRGRETLIWD